jgi:hypothetical protein
VEILQLPLPIFAIIVTGIIFAHLWVVLVVTLAFVKGAFLMAEDQREIDERADDERLADLRPVAVRMTASPSVRETNHKG